MPNLLLFVMRDGTSKVAACELDRRHVSQSDLSLTGLDDAPAQPFVTFVSDDGVESVPSESVRAILPVERDFQIPIDTSVFRFALIA